MSKPNKVLIFGATSAIAHETAKLFAKDGASLYLCSRNDDDLKRLASDLKVRGAQEVVYATFDALQPESITSVINQCLEKFPELDTLLIAHGTLPDQELCETDLDEMRKALEINFTSAATVVLQMLPHFDKQGNGTIAGISSVAGDRGRKKNYIYGAAKEAFTVLLSGVRQRFSDTNVKVITIKPGFVDTPMTAHLEKGLLFASADTVAKGIYDAIGKGKEVVYLPWFWKWIMLIIKSLPEKIFKKMDF